MSRSRSLFAALLGLASLAPAAAVLSAQTVAVPQLLPYTINALTGTATGPSVGVPFSAGGSCGAGSTLTATDALGDGCLATQVSVPTPRAVLADSQGNVYLVDGTNNNIRRIDARTGILTIYAGGATAVPAAGAACATGSTLTATGTLGDGCLATQVKIAAPEGLALDPTGNLWFSDFTTGTVRRIDRLTGVLSTVVNTAGTPGYKATGTANPGVAVSAAQGQLYRPYGIAFDKNGTLYIADNGNNVVDVANLGTSTITVAGISIPAGGLQTIAGAGCAFGTTPGCNVAAYYGTGNGQAPAITLDAPDGVAVDNAGNIYIADSFPYDVRVINTAGVSSFYADSTNKRSGLLVRGPASAALLGSTYGVSTDAYGNVYIGYYDGSPAAGASFVSFLARVDAPTGIIYPIAGQTPVITGTAAAPAAGAAQTGATYCAQKTDAVGDGCPATQATLFKPYQPTVDALGNAYIADQGNGLTRKVSTGTQFPATTVGTGKTQTLLVHYGTADTQGTYSVKTYPGFTVGAGTCNVNTDTTSDCTLPVTFTPTAPGFVSAPFVITSTGGRTNTYTLTGLATAAALAVDPGTRQTLATTNATSLSTDALGNTFATVAGATSITKVTAAGVTSTIGTGLTGAVATTSDPSGNVYVALPTSVIQISSTGTQSTYASGFAKLGGIVADSFGNVYVSDSTANTVTLITAGSLIQRVVATGLSGPTGLALDANNNVFAANTIANNIAEIPANGAAITTFGTGLSSPAAVATDAAGSVYVADTRNGRTVFIPNENGTLNATDQIAIVTGLTAPAGIAITPAGTLLVADGAIYSYSRSVGTIAFGNDAIGTQISSPADLINSGNLTAGVPTFTATGNTTDFTLTPATLPTLNAGFAANLTAGFKPTVAGQRAATYTFTSPAGATSTLTLTGNGIVPATPTTTTITANPTTGTYGQTVTLTFTVAVATGPVPTGTVKVLVDTTPYTQTLANGTSTLTLTALGAGTHTVTAQYTGDTNSNASTANPVTVTLAKAPLTIAINPATRAYFAANPTFTGTVTGAVNNDQIGVAYSTTATATSAPGTYPITATLTGTALANYSVTAPAGVLTVTKAATTVNLTTSLSTTYNTPVTLTATIVPQAGGNTTGTVTFYNGTTVLGTVAVAANSASTVVTFTITGQSTTNSLTAVYSGDGNYTGSTSAAATVVASFPGFALTGVPTTATIVQGQTALLNFTLTPTFGYAGTVTFSCTGLPNTVGCIFSPSSITSAGTNTANLIALSITTQQPNGLAAIPSVSKFTFAILPGLALLIGLASRRRKLNLRVVLMLVFGLIATIQLSGCSAQHLLAGTPKGTYTITVTATGTPSVAAPTTTITQQFPVTVTVQ